MENERPPQAIELSEAEKQERKRRSDKKLTGLFLRFSEEVAKKTGRTFEQTLLEDSPLYRRFGLGKGRDPENPVWKEYLAGLSDASSKEDWTYDFLQNRKAIHEEIEPQEPGRADETCFTGKVKGNTLELHFDNKDADPAGPLSSGRIQARRDELEKIFRDVKASSSNVEWVTGGSWLFDFPPLKKKRILPEMFIESATTDEDPRLDSSALWGQFIDSNGNIKEDLAEELLENLKTTPADKLGNAFPLKQKKATLPIEVFYKEYGITDTEPTPPQTSEGSSKG